MKDFKISLIDYKDGRIIEGLDDLIVFHEKYIEYKWKCSVELTDGDVKLKVDYQGCRATLKDSISSVQAYWSAQHERYVCDLAIGDSPCWMFKTMKEAVGLKDLILKWLTDE